MNESKPLFYEQSILIAAPAAMLYDMVADITRTGEWSPVCTSCWWDDPSKADTVGSWFTGRNEEAGRTWETRSKVVVADPAREFAFIVGGKFVRWGYTFTSRSPKTTEVTESWKFLPDGIAMFEEKYGEKAPAAIAARTESAHNGIPQTLEMIKRIAESTSS